MWNNKYAINSYTINRSLYGNIDDDWQDVGVTKLGRDETKTWWILNVNEILE